MKGTFEDALIGSIILDSVAVLYTCDTMGVTADWFTFGPNRAAFTKAEKMAREGKYIDLLTLSDAILKDDPDYNPEHLERCVDAAPVRGVAESYIQELRPIYLRRAAKRLATAFADSMASSVNPEDDASRFATELMEVTAPRTRKSDTQIANELKEQWRLAQDGQVADIPTPWTQFNKALGGVHNGLVTVLAGRQGKGKSSALATWANFLAGLGVPVGWLAFEDGRKRTIARVAGIRSDVNVFGLDTGMAGRDTYQKAVVGLDDVLKLPLYIEDRHMTSGEIVTWATRMVAKYGIKVLFADAFKDIIRSERTTAEDDAMSQTLVRGARRLDIPIVVSHHVRKQDVQQKKDAWLRDDDVRGSGQITQDARQVILIQSKIVDGEEEFYFEIRKNNYGATGLFRMQRISNRCTWQEYAEEPPEDEQRLPYAD